MSLLSVSAIAGSMGMQMNSWSPILELNVGPAWEKYGFSQNLQLKEDVQKYYDAKKTKHTLVNVEVYPGFARKLSSLWIGQVGLALAATSNAQLQGDMWEDSDPEFNNYYYNYKINSLRLAIKGKLIADVTLPVKPYVYGSIGAGFNQGRNYVIAHKIFEEVPEAHFQSNASLSFAYTLGLGVQRAFNSHWIGGVGYEFADWGKNHLKKAPGQTIGEGPRLDHMYTNTLQFSVGYVA